MKRLSFIATALIAVIVAFATSSCTNEKFDGAQTTENDGSALYVTFSVSMATATRAATTEDGGSTDGTEVGQTSENTISSVLLVLTDSAASGASVLTTFALSTENEDLSASTETQYVGKLKSTDIADALGRTVYVWVICNPAAGFSLGTLDDIYSTTTSGLPATAGSFLMTNAQPHSVMLPEETALAQYTETYPFNLGNVYVERSVARFDFKDGSEEGFYTYTLSDSAESAYYTDGEDNALNVSVEITDLALINQSNAFYYFRRVSADGTPTDAVIGGAETYNSTSGLGNYVVDTDYTFKSGSDAEIVVGAGGSNNFTDYLEDGTGAWESWTSVDDIAANSEDSWEGNTSEPYNIWCYAPENTIPQDSDGADTYQRHHISTGVVFKTIVTTDATEGSALATDMAAGSRIYVYNGNIWFGSWETVKAQAANYDIDGVVAEVEAEIADLTADSYEYDAIFEGQGFNWIDYDAAEEAYVSYYYYWNRHNDNGSDGLMGPMEFAVVRNNVYKLQVTDITGLGRHPQPGPAEDSDLNIRVDVTVLPWVVRQNDIQF